jgi:23S rRNA (adenine2503-C2)-methyltransferase
MPPSVRRTYYTLIMKNDIKAFVYNDLEKSLVEYSLPRFLAQQLFDWIYKKRVEDFSQMSNVASSTRAFLKDNFYFSGLKLLKQEVSRDKSEKFLFALQDSAHIEAVHIPDEARQTLCVSSQVGCKFSCTFCMSGQLGFKRNLTSSEIINQYLYVHDAITPRACLPARQAITNIVFMGVGEPLDNFFNVTDAIRILMEPKGLHVGKHRITISTCGLAPEIVNLSKLALGIKLSVSLHASTDAQRNQVMPVNKKYPLKELITAIKHFSRHEVYPVTFEYVLIKGFNTAKEDAIRLSQLLKGMRYKINLIPYNLSSLEFAPPLEAEIIAFTQELKEQGVFFTLRKPRGQDIGAACGQLRASWNNKVNG